MSLLFSGIFVSQSKLNQSFLNTNSIKLSSQIISLVSSDNFIYILTPSNQNKTSLIKYNSNLKQVWNFTYNYNNLNYGQTSLSIISVNDQNALIHLSTVSSPQILLIVNQNGIQARFDANKLTSSPIGYFSYFVLPFGSNYFISVQNLASSKPLIEAYCLKSDNTTQSLFYKDLDSNNLEQIVLFPNPFYKDSNTIEIPFYGEKLNNTTYNQYYVNSSYFLEYNIKTQQVRLKPSNYVSVANELKQDQSFTNNYLKEASYLFPFNQNFLGFDIGINSQQILFKIWSNNALLAESSSKYSIPTTVSSPIFFRQKPMDIISEGGFQIRNSAFINVDFNNGEYLRNVVPILLSYTRYSFYSTLQVFNYLTMITTNERLISISITHLQDTIVFYGGLNFNFGEYYFIKFYNFKSTVLEEIYLLPISIKSPIGFIFILPPVYLLKKSKSSPQDDDTYPKYKK